MPQLLMASAEPTQRVLPLIHQRWRNLTFLHWAVAADVVQRFLPARLTADTFDGSAWVTLTPFSTTCSFAGIPLPGERRFPETNVRTYVRGPDGRDGLWFFSLDVTNRTNVVLGRGIGLPYHVGDMGVTSDGAWHYEGRRAKHHQARYDIRVEPGFAIEQTQRDVFLTGRWSAYVEFAGRIVRYDVAHEPWPLHDATVVTLDETMLAAAGIQRLGDPIVQFTPGVDAKLAPGRLIF